MTSVYQCDNGSSSPRSNVRLVGADDGQVFHLLGDGAGTEGVEITDGGIDGLIEAQIVTQERRPVRMDGGVLRAVKTDVLEATIELVVSSQRVDESFEEVDGRLREALTFELDPWNPGSKLARIEWETKDDLRFLEIALASTSYSVERIPQRRGFWLWTIRVRAYNPFWQAEPIVEPLVFEAPGSQTLTVQNPTGVPCFQRWSGTVAQWRLPDPSWQGPRWQRHPGGKAPARTVLYPDLTPVHGGIVVDYDPAELAVRDKHDTNLIAQMPTPGDAPLHCWPTHLQEQQLTVTAVKVPAGGAAIKLIQPLRYRRPWGRI